MAGDKGDARRKCSIDDRHPGSHSFERAMPKVSLSFIEGNANTRAACNSTRSPRGTQSR